MDYTYKLTILTPSYNRAHCLQSLYESLEAQTNHDFQWLVIDDGSTDGTQELFKNLKSDSFFIEYHSKKNGGKHTAINYAHNYIKGEYTFIVDSDDTLTSNAVQEVLNVIEKYKKNKNIKIFSFLRGSNISDPFNKDFPDGEIVSNHIDFRLNANRPFDCAEIVESDIFCARKFPVFEAERFLGEGYLWTYWGFRYDTVYVNKVIYICAYLEGGLTKSGRSMRMKCPLGGMENSNTYLESCHDRRVNTKLLIKEVMLFICYGKLARKNIKQMYKQCHRKILLLFLYPLGVLLYYHWKRLYL